MTNFGITYKGGKSLVARKIIDFLPIGNRLVDLFGGGCAITHCGAVYGRKWKQHLYNDKDTGIYSLVKEGCQGKYSRDTFKLEFVTRDRFHKEKQDNPYIRYIWSFCYNSRSYLYGKHIEESKKDYFYSHSEKQLYEDCIRIEYINRLKRLQQLQQLKDYDVEFTNMDYTNYKHKDGDVVYCDIPYEDTSGYEIGKFNHAEFYNWAYKQDYLIFISSLKISDNRFYEVFEINHRFTIGANNNNRVKEKIFTNKPYLLTHFM